MNDLKNQLLNYYIRYRLQKKTEMSITKSKKPRCPICDRKMNMPQGSKARWNCDRCNTQTIIWSDDIEYIRYLPFCMISYHEGTKSANLYSITYAAPKELSMNYFWSIKCEEPKEALSEKTWAQVFKMKAFM